MKPNVSSDATSPPSRRSMFSPSVQSAQRDTSGAITSANEPSGVISEKDMVDAGSRSEPVAPALGSDDDGGGGAQFTVAISVTVVISKRSGRSSSPPRTGNLDWLST